MDQSIFKKSDKNLPFSSFVLSRLKSKILKKRNSSEFDKSSASEESNASTLSGNIQVGSLTYKRHITYENSSDFEVFTASSSSNSDFQVNFRHTNNITSSSFKVQEEFILPDMISIKEEENEDEDPLRITPKDVLSIKQEKDDNSNEWLITNVRSLKEESTTDQVSIKEENQDNGYSALKNVGVQNFQFQAVSNQIPSSPEKKREFIQIELALEDENYCSEDEETPERSQNLNCEMITSQEPPLIPTIYRAKLGRPPKNSTEIQYSSSNPNQTNQQNWTYYTCPTCNKQYKDIYTLKRHQKEKHSETRERFPCKTCGRLFTRQSNSQLHNYTHMNSEELKTTNIYNKTCEICSQVFFNKNHYTKHINRHNSYRPEIYQCQICKKTFKEKYKLLYHKKIDHPTKEDRMRLEAFYKYSCEICERKFNVLSKLDKHMMTHETTTVSSFKCPKCKKEFNSETARGWHLKEHNLNSLLPCDECGKKFTRRSHVVRHKKIHERNRMAGKSKKS